MISSINICITLIIINSSIIKYFPKDASQNLCIIINIIILLKYNY